MAHDSFRNQTILFGGSNAGGTTNNETWSWNGSNWTQLSPVTSPPARTFTAMTYDPDRQVIVLFGGFNGASTLSDTWEWNGTNWSEKSPATVPAARSFHSMTYDTFQDRVVLVGGVSGPTFYQETYTWNGTNWTLQSPETAPPGFSGSSVAFNQSSNMLLLFGGTNSTSPYVYDQTWQYADPTNIPTATATGTPTASPTPTSTATNTPTASPTFTSTPTSTATSTPTAAPTLTSTPTYIPTSTSTPTPTSSANAALPETVCVQALKDSKGLIRYASPFAGDYKLIRSTKGAGSRTFEYQMVKGAVKVTLSGEEGQNGTIATDITGPRLSQETMFRGRPNSSNTRSLLSFSCNGQKAEATTGNPCSQSPLGEFYGTETIKRKSNQKEEQDSVSDGVESAVFGGGGGGSGGSKSTVRKAFYYTLGVVSGSCASSTPVPTEKSVTITGTVNNRTPSDSSRISTRTISGETYALLYPKGSGTPTADSLPIDYTTVNDNGGYTFENQKPGEYDIYFYHYSGAGTDSTEVETSGLRESTITEVGFDPPFVSVVAINEGENVAPRADQEALRYNDSGCTISDKSVDVYNVILGVQSLEVELSEQLTFNNMFVSQKLKGSIQRKYFRTLSQIQKTVLESATDIVIPLSGFPRIFRSNCPAENKCTAANYANVIRKMLAKVNKVEGLSLRIYKKGLESLKLRKVASKNTKYLSRIKGIASEVRSAIKKLPVGNNICPRL